MSAGAPERRRTAIGLIGAGLSGIRHARAWATLADRATLVAVAAPDERAACDAAALTGAQVYGEYRHLLEHPQLDAVDICVPPHLHAEIVCAAAEAGLHVLCEKPMAPTLAEADRIAAAVTKAGVVYLAGHNTLFLPTVRRAASFVRNGDLGALQVVRSLDCFGGAWTAPARWALEDYAIPHYLRADAWRGRHDLLQGGALIDGGVHALYRLLHVSGATPTSVVARTRTFHDDLGWTAEDSAFLLIDFDDGSIGEVLISYAFEPPTTDTDTLLQIVGRDAYLGVGEDDLVLRPAGWGAPARHRLWDIVGREAMWAATLEAECRHFVSCVVDGADPIAGLEDARTVLRVVRAAYESVERQRVVSLAPDARPSPGDR